MKIYDEEEESMNNVWYYRNETSEQSKKLFVIGMIGVAALVLFFAALVLSLVR